MRERLFFRPWVEPMSRDLKFRIQVSPMNCVGCGLCVNICPGKPQKDADGKLVMDPKTGKPLVVKAPQA
jgi:ferredoxin